MVNSKSVVGVKSGDSGVVILYQVDNFMFTWSAECFFFVLLAHKFYLGSQIRCQLKSTSHMKWVVRVIHFRPSCGGI